jgi:hypothetical protein
MLLHADRAVSKDFSSYLPKRQSNLVWWNDVHSVETALFQFKHPHGCLLGCISDFVVVAFLLMLKYNFRECALASPILSSSLFST